MKVEMKFSQTKIILFNFLVLSSIEYKYLEDGINKEFFVLHIKNMDGVQNMEKQ